MKLFFKKIIILGFILLGLLFLLVLFDYRIIGSQYKYNYNAAIIDKINRLNSICEPKIILVGNSNLAFGINSKMIEESMGMPVVNLGLHGGLGNAFHEEIAKQNIAKGDIVVVCHSEYSDSDMINDAELALLTYDYNDSVFPIFRLKDFPNLLADYPAYLRKSIIMWITNTGNERRDNCYSREAFNEYGDVIFKPDNLQIKNEYFKDNYSVLPTVNDTCAKRLNEFNKYCNDHGATMVVAGYPIERGCYDKFSIDEYIKCQQELSDSLDCPIISDFTDYFYPYDYFYNCILHLNEKGVEVRTSQLIEDLKKWLHNE